MLGLSVTTGDFVIVTNVVGIIAYPVKVVVVVYEPLTGELPPFSISSSVIDVSLVLTAIAGLTVTSGDASLSVSETESRFVVMEEAGQLVVTGVTES